MARGHVEVTERVFPAGTTICREPRGRKEPDSGRSGRREAARESDGWRGARAGPRRAVMLGPGCLLESLSRFSKKSRRPGPAWDQLPPTLWWWGLGSGTFQSSLSGPVRQPKVKNTDGGLRCQGEESLVYSKCDGKPLRDSKQGNDVVWFTFLKCSSHYSLENGYGTKHHLIKCLQIQKC